MAQTTFALPPRALAPELDARALLLARVREVIVERLSAGVGFELVARELHMSTRTLHRRLTASGVTYHALLESVRRAVAFEALGAPHETISAISERLGFADPSNFRRAFRRWTGLSPHKYRRARAQLSLVRSGD